MTRKGSNLREVLHRHPEISSKYLARTRSRRIARRPGNRLGLNFFLILAGIAMSAVAMLVAGQVADAFGAFTVDLPPVSQLDRQLSFRSAEILDRNGKVLYRLNDSNGGKRLPVPLANVSQQLIDATIATEDKGFYSNAGVDPVGIARAVWQNLAQGALAQGASTITQQLAKNVLIDQASRTDKSYVRKIQEAVLAFRISESYSKDEILEMYLNQVYYGHLSYGIEAASETYFGKSADQLNLKESSMLAGLPQAPSQYDPFLNIQVAKERQAHVLDRMVEEGYITRERADQAGRAELAFQRQNADPFEAPHFVMYVRQLLEQKYGADVVYREGLKVTTTLDLDFNKIAENAINTNMVTLRTQDANNSAVVAIEPATGQILAMVGSRDYFDSSIGGQVNMATSPRQPGSTIKPIEYAVAFSKGWGPETIITDAPTAFPNTAPYLPAYQPQNFDNKFDGPMTLRHALSNSKNIPAIKVLMYDGLPDFLRVAGQLGIHFDNPEVFGLSLALGAGSVSPLAMAGAYAALDNYGVYHDPVAILRVEDWKGDVLEQWTPEPGRQVLSPPQAYMVTSILADNWARTPLQGPSSVLRLDQRPAGAKTGSTDDYKDSWTIGYTPDLVTAVWVGNTDNRPMKEVLGSMGAGRIWHSFMEDVHKNRPVAEFVAPDGVTEYRLCLETGTAAYQGCKVVLYEVYPKSYTPAKYAIVPGLTSGDSSLTPGYAIGQTVSPQGKPLVFVSGSLQTWMVPSTVEGASAGPCGEPGSRKPLSLIR